MVYKINEPIRVATKNRNSHIIFATKNFMKVEVNEEVLSFIDFLRKQKEFDDFIIDKYAQKHNYSENQYRELFKFLKDNELIIQKVIL